MYYAERFKDALKNGGRALFLGVKAEQMAAAYRGHPRLIFWDSDSPQITNARFDELPVRTRVVVATRWLGHAPYNKAYEMCRRSNVLFMGKLASTGEITQMLKEALPDPSATPVAESIDIHKAVEAMVPADTPPPPPPSEPVPELYPTPEPGMQFQTITACVRFYAQREIERPAIPGKRQHIPMTYYEGVAVRARAHGWDTNADKVQAIFSNLRSVHRARVERHQLVEAAAAAARVAEAVPATMVPIAPPPPLEPLPANLEKLLGYADELEIRAITAVELADELRRIVKEHRELREVKEKYDALTAVMRGEQPHKVNGSAASTY